MTKSFILLLYHMRRKNRLIITVSLVSIFLLIGIELFLIIKIYHLKSDNFEYQYNDIINKRSAIQDFPEDLNPFRGSFKVMDSYAPTIVNFYESGFVEDSIDNAQWVLKQYHTALLDNEQLTAYLKVFMEDAGLEPDFEAYFVINKLSLTDSYSRVDIYDAKKNQWAYPDTLNIPKGARYANRYYEVRNGFEIKFDFLVDFSNKEKIVIRQMAGILVISLLAVIAVIFVFYFTLRNLLEERRLSQSKTDFINNMTHELKTPLSTISIATRTLENENVLSNQEKIVQTARMISRQNRQLTKQINHLLEISMWERKQFELDKQWVELEPFFKDLIEAFKVECKGCQVEIEENYNLKTEKGFFDETQIVIALHNIMVNAVKYCNSEPRIQFDVSAGDLLVIGIRDNGIGMNKEQLKHIFDKFYRVHTGNIHKVKGLGLGLFYVKQIIEAHKGTVEVSSKPGQGTHFILNIPTHGKNQSTIS